MKKLFPLHRQERTEEADCFQGMTYNLQLLLGESCIKATEQDTLPPLLPSHIRSPKLVPVPKCHPRLSQPTLQLQYRQTTAHCFSKPAPRTSSANGMVFHSTDHHNFVMDNVRKYFTLPVYPSFKTKLSFPLSR